jgi:hypothetical protein
MRLSNMAAVITSVVALVACSGGAGANDAGLRDGVYRFELSRQYLIENGIPADQARSESGLHEVTIDRGSFIDRWRAEDGTTRSCWGTYTQDGARVAFRWAGGCTGDWAMSYAVDGNVLTWSDFEPLDPDAGPDESRVIQVFNAVPWTRVGEVPDEGEK